ncbi:MAG TPA: RDD family protein [Chryseosolibacter sp.]|nr:RDD family protein [Chryseosolibacter sp.]
MNQTISLTTFKKASFWKRLIAAVIDNPIIGTTSILISTGFGMTEVVESVFAFTLFYCYGTSLEHFYQVTLGKLIMKLKVVGIDGQRPSMFNSFYRNFGKIVSMIPFFYGFLRILAPHHRQAIHDELGRCVVIDVTGQIPPDGV